MKNIITKIFTQRNRNILSILIIISGLIYLINYIFYTPSYINEYISTNIYKEPANSYFDDENFYNCIIDNYNKANYTSLPYTQSLTDSQLQSIKGLSCSNPFKDDNKKIKSTKGLEKLINLTSLDVGFNQLTSLDVSKNTELTSLDVSVNQLTSLDVSNNPKLTKLEVINNQLTSLDVSKNIKLTYLYVRYNQLTEIDVSNNPALAVLYVERNQLSSLDVSNDTALTTLLVDNNQLTSLDVSNNPELTKLNVAASQLTSLDVSNNPKLYHLDVSYNQLTSLDVSNNPRLTELDVKRNQLTTLDVSNNTALTSLDVSWNKLTTLDVSKNTALTYLDVSNYFERSNKLTELDVSNNTALTSLGVGNIKLTSLDVSKNPKLTVLEAGDNQLTEIDVSNNPELTKLNVAASQLTSLDVSKNTKLTELDVGGNQLTNIDVSNNTALTSLDVSWNKLTTIDVSKNINLERLDLTDNYCYILLNDKIDFLKLPNGWSMEKVSNSEYVSDDNKAIKIGKDTIYFKIYNSQKKEIHTVLLSNKDDTIHEYNIYVYNITSDNYIIEDNNIKYIDDFNIDNIKFDYGGVEGYTNYIEDNKLIIKHNDKVIKEYNLVKLEVTSSLYNIIDNNIIYFNNFNTDNIDINYGTKELKDNKLLIKYKDKVIKEYNLYQINTKYKANKDTIFIGEDLKVIEDKYNSCNEKCQTNIEGLTCEDTCDSEYETDITNLITNNITSTSLELSYSSNKLICKLNDINITFNLSSKEEYLEINKYTKNEEEKIISRIPINTNIEVFKNNIITNIDYNIKDKDNIIIDNRNLKTGDKIIFNYSDNKTIEYTLSLIGDSNGDGIINIIDIGLMANHVSGNKPLEGVYLLSAKIDNNSDVNIIDIMKIVKYITEGSEF